MIVCQICPFGGVKGQVGPQSAARVHVSPAAGCVKHNANAVAHGLASSLDGLARLGSESEVLTWTHKMCSVSQTGGSSSMRKVTSPQTQQ